MKENEIWKDASGYEGLYQVSNRGRVRSIERRSFIGRKCGGRMMKPGYNSRGYLVVSLHKNGKKKTKSVHRIVAETFLPNPNGLPQVNHRDEIKGNNNVENLEWCDAKYNINYGMRIEKLSKKVRAVNVETAEVITFNSTREAGRKGYRSSNVSMACKGAFKTKAGTLIGGDGRTYKGYRWSYDDEKIDTKKDLMG